MIKVKAFLHTTSGEVKEIRRFEAKQYYQRTLYDDLRRNIKELFPVSDVRMHYKDNDGDLVTFSSQREMAEGLNFLKDETFYVYIYPAEDTSVLQEVKPSSK